MVRLGKKEDAYQVEEIFEDAKRKFAFEKTYQWKGDYPNINNFYYDLENNQVIVYENNDVIDGVATVVFTKDLNYEVIQGKWLNDDKYVSIHRIATKAGNYNKGIGYSLFKNAEEIAIKNGINNIKIDTHENNISMRHLLNKLGYQECGKIILLNRDDLTLKERERVAYQKLLK